MIGSKEIEVIGQEMDLPKDLLSILHFHMKSSAFVSTFTKLSSLHCLP